MIFGPQMLIGIAAAESVPKKAAATANGFVDARPILAPLSQVSLLER